MKNTESSKVFDMELAELNVATLKIMNALYREFNRVKRSKPHLNKSRFDDFDSAWNCFTYEYDHSDGKDVYKDFSTWLFNAYVPGVVKNGSK